MSRSASASVTPSSVISLNSDAVRGFADFGASSPSTSVTYGPNRPFFATTAFPDAGSTPSGRSMPAGVASNARARSTVSSSGGRSSSTFARAPEASSM